MQVTVVEIKPFGLQCRIKVELDSGHGLHCWDCSETAIAIKYRSIVCIRISHCFGYLHWEDFIGL